MTKQRDTVVVGNVYCLIDSVSNAIINGNRWMPPKLVYRLAPVRAILTWRAPRFTLTMDGATTTVEAHMVVIGNSGAYGHGLNIVPSARIDDGMLDVLVVRDGPKRAVASFMRDAQRGTHVTRPEDVFTPVERWGIPEAIGHGWSIWFKGGWRPPGGEENSGQVTHQASLLVHRRGERVALAVLTDEAPWGGGGFEAIEGVARRLLSSPPPHRGGWPVP